MNNILLLAIIGVSAVFIGMQVVHGQGQTNSSQIQSLDNFLNYTNNTMKFSIQHPSNWKFIESNLPLEVLFRRQLDPGIVDWDWLSFDVIVEKPQPQPYLDTDTMTLKLINTTLTLEQRVQQELNSISALPDNNIIRQNEVTVGGHNGSKVEYTSRYYYAFTIVTFANGNFYILTYHDDPLKVPETLPLANKMVESFQVIK